MDVTSVSASSLHSLQAQAATAVQRKAMELESSAAAQLLEALPQPAPVPDPGATVGGRIDLFV